MHAQRFEQKAERLRIAEQPLGTHSEKLGGQRGVGEVALRLSTHARPRANGGIPSEQLVDKIKILEQVEVERNRIAGRIRPLIAERVVRDRIEGRSRCHIAREGCGNPARGMRAPALLGNAHLEKRIEISIYRRSRRLEARIHQSRPPSTANGLRKGRQTLIPH